MALPNSAMEQLLCGGRVVAAHTNCSHSQALLMRSVGLLTTAVRSQALSALASESSLGASA